MYQSIKKNNNKIDKKYSLSSYKPTKKEASVILEVQHDMKIGRDILTRPWMYYNGRTILQEMEENQKRFNSYIPPKSDDPDESWRTNTVRPLTRNKLISIAAHVTAKLLYPNVFAQNKNDEEDKIAAEVIRDTIEWAIENSEYKMKYLGAIMGALTDPVAILEVGFAKVMRTVKEKHLDGSYTEKQILDEVFSGFVQNYRQCNEVYITNPFERNIQKQRAIATRTLIDYSEAKAKYGQHRNFKFVQKGVRTIFDNDTKIAYNIADPDLVGDFVERVVYMNRSKDLEVVFINGIMVTDCDECNSRRDKMYGLASFGYELLNNGNFFYYKSAVNKLAPDQDVIDSMYNMVMDGTFLDLMPPMALFGSEEVTSSLISPGTITSFQDVNTKIERLGAKNDTRGGMEAISLLEKSMSESSQDQFQMGMMTPGERTAQEISAIQDNAKIALGLFGKMVQNFVEQIGTLMISDILQYMTLAEISELSGDNVALKFKSILLKDKIVNGKKVTKKLRFTNKGNSNTTPTHDDLMSHSLDLYNEEIKNGDSTVIYDINPSVLKDIKFFVSTDPTFMKEKSQELEKALNIEAYDRLIQSPIIGRDTEAMLAVTRDFLIEQYAPGESDKYLPKNKPVEQNPMAQDINNPQDAVAGNVKNQFTQKGVNSNLTQQITGSTSIKKKLM